MNRLSAIAFLVLVAAACGDDAGGPTLVPTTIATVQPAPDSCTLGVPAELSALVTDADGRPVPDVGVTFTVETGLGAVSPSTSTTDDHGLATTVFTCSPPVGAGPAVVVATFEGVEQNSARWPLITRAGTLVKVDFTVFLRPDSIPIAVGYPQPLALIGLLRDGFGGSPPEATVTWEIASGGGSLSQHSTEAFRCYVPPEYAPGLIEHWCVSNSWTLGAGGPGVQAIRLSSPGVPGFEDLFHVRVVPGPLTIVREPPTDFSGEAGSVLPTPLAVRLLAGDGSPLPRVVVRFGAVGGELEPVNPADVVFNSFHLYTDINGRAAMQYTFPTIVGGTTAAGAAPFMLGEDGAAPTTGWSPSVLPGPPVQLRMGFGGNDQSGSVGQPLANPLTVAVVDQFGNAVGGQSVTWAVTSGGGSLAQSTTASDGIGVHENFWTLGPTPGTQTATASFGASTVTFTAHASAGS